MSAALPRPFPNVYAINIYIYIYIVHVFHSYSKSSEIANFDFENDGQDIDDLTDVLRPNERPYLPARRMQ